MVESTKDQVRMHLVDHCPGDRQNWLGENVCFTFIHANLETFHQIGMANIHPFLKQRVSSVRKQNLELTVISLNRLSFE